MSAVQYTKGRDKTFLSNAAIGQYLRLKFISAGVVGVAGATDLSIGISRNDVFATTLPITLMLANMEGTVPVVAASAITAGAYLYGAASGKVDDVDNGNLEGIAMTAATGDGSIIEMLPISAKPIAALGPESGASVAASTAVSNTTADTAFDKSFAIAANTLNAGDIIKIRAQVIATATNSTDTLLIKVKVGTVTLVSTAAVDVANNDIGYVDAHFVVRTAGASGTCVGAGSQGLGVPGTVTAKPFLLASTTLDTTAACDVTVTATWSVASASNSCRLDVLDVEIIRA